MFVRFSSCLCFHDVAPEAEQMHKPLVCIQALPPLKRKTAVPNNYQTECTWTNFAKKQLYIRILNTYPQKPYKYEAHTIQPLSLLLYLLTYHLQDLFTKKLDIFFLIRITNNSSIQADARHLKTESAPNARKPSIVLQLLEVNWNMSRRCCKTCISFTIS